MHFVSATRSRSFAVFSFLTVHYRGAVEGNRKSMRNVWKPLGYPTLV